MVPKTFDIEIGMAVHGTDGELIGNVTEIDGFGSTRIDHATDVSAAQVTQAHTGTGYFKVSRAGSDALLVPFNGIQKIVPGQGVTLTAAIETEIRRQADALAPQSVAETRPISGSGFPQLRRWRGWMPWRKDRGL